MLFAGLRHAVVMPCGLGIIAPHQPLQFREFIDHFRGQIGLGDARGLFGQIRLGTDMRRNLAGKGGDAFNPVRL